jgi:iron complex transport system substrate-binding protein
VCAVCAVSYDDVRGVAERLASRPRVLSLDPETLGEVLTDVTRLGEATGAAERGSRLRAELDVRLDRVRESVADATRPKVAALEWLDPPYVGGHWVPEMIEAAGGRDPLGQAGRDSRTASWEEIAAAEPEVVVVMPCGLYVGEAVEQATAYRERIRALGARAVYAVDAAASFSRPGPRLVDGVELLGHLLHPTRALAPKGVGWQALNGTAPTGQEQSWASTGQSSRSR